MKVNKQAKETLQGLLLGVIIGVLLILGVNYLVNLPNMQI